MVFRDTHRVKVVARQHRRGPPQRAPGGSATARVVAGLARRRRA
eukprot:SAG31_NODE_853_length_11512_cov_42.663279_1_plen_43_part_10